MQRIFQYVFVACVALATIVRCYYTWGYRRSEWEPAPRAGLTPVEGVLMGLWGICQICAFVYIFSPWLSFADYSLPTWTGWPGTVAFAAAVLLLWRSHADLGPHWSPRVQVRQDHELVTTGIYTHIRHPMYAAHLLWAVAQPLLLHNWLAGPGALVFFVPFLLIRISREERTMLDAFGQEYRAYVNRTGRLIPPLQGRQEP